jgi:DNA-binding transcriptional LysR family regulator
VTAADLAGRPLVVPRSGSAIKAAVDRFFGRADQELRVSLESGDPWLLRSLVSTGFGAGLLPASLTRRQGPPIETRDLRPAIRLPVALLWPRRGRRPPAARAFIDFVRREAARS